MKAPFRTLILALICLGLNASPALAHMGSFVITKSTYLYQEGDKNSKRILTRKRRVLEVLDMTRDAEGTLYFRVHLASNNNQVGGTGFILETKAELLAEPDKLVQVYAELPTTKADLNDYWEIRAGELSTLGESKLSRDFPQLSFQEVSYQSVLPRVYWVPEWGGIYRPDRDIDWFESIYPKIEAAKLDQSVKEKLLMGLIEPGFGMEEVRLSWGEPLEERPLPESTKVEWIYKDRKLVFEEGKLSQLL